MDYWGDDFDEDCGEDADFGDVLNKKPWSKEFGFPHFHESPFVKPVSLSLCAPEKANPQGHLSSITFSID